MRNKSLQDATKFNIVMIIPWTPCVGSLPQVENLVKEFGTSSHNTDMSLQFFSKLLPRVILEFNCVSSSGKWHQSCTVETRWQLLLFIKQTKKIQSLSFPNVNLHNHVFSNPEVKSGFSPSLPC